MTQFGFQVAQQALWEPSGYNLWLGRVPVVVTAEAIKPTAGGNGNHMLVVTFKALAGEYAGQENSTNFNLYNSSSQAVDMAQRQVSAMARAMGRPDVVDSSQLVGGQFLSIWVPHSYSRNNKQTGVSEQVESCQLNDYHLLSGQTLKEAMAGQAASSPYHPDHEPRRGAPAAQAQQQPPAQAQPQTGFTPPGPQPGQFTPPAQQTQQTQQQPQFGGGAPMQQPGFAPPAAGGAPAPAPAMGQFGGQPAPQPGFGTAGSGFSPPGAAPGPGFAPPGGMAPPGQFMPPGAAPGGAAPAYGAAPQPGPWNNAPGFAPPR